MQLTFSDEQVPSLLGRNGGLSGRALGPTRCCKYNSLECVFMLLHDRIISHAFVEKGKGGGEFFL